MKRLTATLCLTLAVLLGSEVKASDLPPCRGSYHHNCFGNYNIANGDKYVGEVRNNKMHGQGTYTAANGTKYVGEFKDDKIHGQGTYTRANGDKYVGEFKDGKKHGQGTYTGANGEKYVGGYKDNKPQGQGTYTGADRNKYVGEFKDGKRNGQGTHTYADGTVREGIWKDGAFKYTQAEWELKLKKLKAAEELRSNKLKAAEELKLKKLRAAEELRLKKLKVAEELRLKKLKAEKAIRKEKASKNLGFRDLKPGLSISDVAELKVCDSSLQPIDSAEGTRCYGIDDIKFRGEYMISESQVKTLQKLTVDLGPIVGVIGIIENIATYLTSGETNIFLQMRETLGEKYKTKLEFSERDRQLFNKQLKEELYTVFEGGQVALVIKRKNINTFQKDFYLYIEYRDLEPAEKFLKMVTPKRAKKIDF
tara:strand:- start:124 stop:1389 length:1266 start_codon:yes stop_codon:yes gene_type:complete